MEAGDGASTTPPTGAPYRFEVLTLFPSIFEGFLQESLLGRARARGLLAIALHDWRRFADNVHGRVDDAPFGGGAGMVLQPGPITRQLSEIPDGPDGRPLRRLLLTPAGRPLDQAAARRWAELPGITMICGRYEGFDARIEHSVDEQVSLGDFVLNGGEVAAMAVIEAVARLLPGMVGNAASLQEESHASGLLEAPQFTRPRVFEGHEVPSVLLGGHHGEVAAWRRAEALARTAQMRPDLLARWQAAQRPDRGVADTAGGARGVAASETP